VLRLSALPLGVRVTFQLAPILLIKRALRRRVPLPDLAAAPVALAAVVGRALFLVMAVGWHRQVLPAEVPRLRARGGDGRHGATWEPA